MKLPREISGDALVRAWRQLDYVPTRQHGSHIRVTTQRDGEHHEVIPHHQPINVGTLHSILKSVASHPNVSIAELLRRLDL